MSPSLIRRVPVRTLWGVIREIDLEAVRRSAESRFEILIAADTLTDAEEVGRLIGPHPWLVAAEVSGAPIAESFALVVLVTRTAELSPGLGGLRDQFASRAPVVVVVVGAAAEGGPAAALARRRETGRVAIPD